MSRGVSSAFGLALVLFEPLVGCLGRTHVPIAQRPEQAVRPTELAVLRTSRSGNELKLETTQGALSISAPLPDVLKIRVAQSSDTRAASSFAVDPAAHAEPLQIEESDTLLLARTPRAILRIDKQPLRLRLLDASGAVMNDDLLRAELAKPEAKLSFRL